MPHEERIMPRRRLPRPTRPTLARPARALTLKNIKQHPITLASFVSSFLVVFSLVFHILLFLFLPAILAYCLILQWLPLGSVVKKLALWALMGILGICWIELQVDWGECGVPAACRKTFFHAHHTKPRPRKLGTMTGSDMAYPPVSCPDATDSSPPPETRPDAEPDHDSFVLTPDQGSQVDHCREELRLCKTDTERYDLYVE
ncbi:hypothetical protein DL767_000092 [Monosporascus sp. MG133]|nr:hypothetical protein DL767_000092 [Monosporascus sp. MG133]